MSLLYIYTYYSICVSACLSVRSLSPFYCARNLFCRSVQYRVNEHCYITIETFQKEHNSTLTIQPTNNIDTIYIS